MKLPMNIEEYPESDIVPADEYEVVIEEITGPSQDKNQKDYISVTFTIRDGEFANRKIFENYVPLTEGSKLRKIAQAAFVDVSNFSDTDDLLGESLRLVVGVQMSKQYGEQNTVRSYIRKK